MGGRDYRTRFQLAYDRGIAKGETNGLKKGFKKGREEGREEGIQLGIEKGEFTFVLDSINEGLFSIDYLESKKKWSKDKIRRFLQFQNEQANTVLN